MPLFTDNFPDIHNDSDLEKLKKEYPKYDPYYIASGAIKERREKFEALYKDYLPYADNHFLSEIKKHFHQRSWEMYVGSTLVFYNIPFTSKNKGPDIKIQKNSKRIFIECVAADKGDTEDRVPEIIYGTVQSVPEEEMRIRIANSLDKKFKRYKKYMEQGLVKESDILIIAVNTGELGHVDGVIPLIFKCLYSIGHPTLSFPIDGKGESKSGWSHCPAIAKKNGSLVPMDFFQRKEHAIISAVIYSSNTVLNHALPMGDEMILVHNPLAKNHMLDNFFPFGKESKVINGYIDFSLFR